MYVNTFAKLHMYKTFAQDLYFLFLTDIFLIYETFDLEKSKKKKGNDKELIQSNPISHPQNQKGKKHIHKFINFHDWHAVLSSEGQITVCSDRRFVFKFLS